MGYWSANEYAYPVECTLADIACPGVSDADASTVSEDAPQEATTDEAVTGVKTDNCALEYDGFACSLCADGYYFSQSRCLPCGSTATSKSTLGALVCFTLLFNFVLSTAIAVLPAARLSTLISVLVLLQKIIVIGQSGVLTLSTNYQWLSQVLDGLSVLNFDFSAFRSGCLVPRITFPILFATTLAMVMFTLMCFMLACWLRYVWMRRNERIRAATTVSSSASADLAPRGPMTAAEMLESAKHPEAREDYRRHVIHSLLILGVIVYMKIIQLQFRGLNCVSVVQSGEEGLNGQVADSQYVLALRVSLETQCFVGPHLIVAIVIFLLLPLYTIGFPCFLFIILCRSFADNRTKGLVGWLRKRLSVLRRVNRGKKDTGVAIARYAAASADEPKVSKSPKSPKSPKSQTPKNHPTSPKSPSMKVRSNEPKAIKLGFTTVTQLRSMAISEAFHEVAVQCYGFIYAPFDAEYFSFGLVALVAQLFIALSEVISTNTSVQLIWLGIVLILHAFSIFWLLPYRTMRRNFQNGCVLLAQIAQTIFLLGLQLSSPAQKIGLGVLIAVILLLLVLLLVRKRLAKKFDSVAAIRPLLLENKQKKHAPPIPVDLALQLAEIQQRYDDADLAKGKLVAESPLDGIVQELLTLEPLADLLEREEAHRTTKITSSQIDRAVSEQQYHQANSSTSPAADRFPMYLFLLPHLEHALAAAYPGLDLSEVALTVSAQEWVQLCRRHIPRVCLARRYWSLAQSSLPFAAVYGSLMSSRWDRILLELDHTSEPMIQPLQDIVTRITAAGVAFSAVHNRLLLAMEQYPCLSEVVTAILEDAQVRDNDGRGKATAAASLDEEMKTLSASSPKDRSLLNLVEFVLAHAESARFEVAADPNANISVRVHTEALDQNGSRELLWRQTREFVEIRVKHASSSELVEWESLRDRLADKHSHLVDQPASSSFEVADRKRRAMERLPVSIRQRIEGEQGDGMAVLDAICGDELLFDIYLRSCAELSAVHAPAASLHPDSLLLTANPRQAALRDLLSHALSSPFLAKLAGAIHGARQSQLLQAEAEEEVQDEGTEVFSPAILLQLIIPAVLAARDACADADAASEVARHDACLEALQQLAAASPHDDSAATPIASPSGFTTPRPIPHAPPPLDTSLDGSDSMIGIDMDPFDFDEERSPASPFAASLSPTAWQAAFAAAQPSPSTVLHHLASPSRYLLKPPPPPPSPPFIPVLSRVDTDYKLQDQEMKRIFTPA